MSEVQETSKRITLLGGPDSGKSTYLGALLDALEAERIRHLRIASLPENLAAINRLTDPLLEGNYPQHTEYGEITPLKVQLQTQADILPDIGFELRAADYSGEELHALFDDRYGWSDAWQERARGDAVMLFVRPAVLVPLPRLKSKVPPDEMARWKAMAGQDLEQAIRRLDPIAPVPGPRLPIDSEGAPAPAARPADAVRVPTVLGLIELLQFLRHARGLAPGELPPEGSFRVAVQVSAWDSVPPEWRQQGPSRFLATHVPLLEDFLWSNFPAVDVFRFGLSSTGGDLNDPSYCDRYLEDPGGFVEWVGPDGKTRRHDDLALPLYWALFGEAAWNLV